MRKNKLPRIVTSVTLIVVGVGIAFVCGNLMLHVNNWMAGVSFLTIGTIGLAIMAIGWAAASGEDIQEMLRDLFSGLSF